MTDLIPIRRELLETIEQTWRVHDKHSAPTSERAEEAICNGLSELRAALATPVHGETVELWAVHAQGSDDIYPAFSKEDAEKHASELNALPMPEGIAVGAVVVHSPWPAAEHWEYLAEEERDHKEQIMALAAQQPKPAAVQEGYVLVPIKPTPEMLEAGDKYLGTPATYKAMLSAAPSAANATEFSQFLSAVMDAAGLVEHGRQSKELSKYLGRMCIQYRIAAAPAPAPVQQQGVPEGWKLVPEKMLIDAASIEALAFVMGGPEEDDGSPTYCDCVMWVGEIDDDGVKRHGIHVYNTECEEEGSTTLAEFAGAAAPVQGLQAGCDTQRLDFMLRKHRQIVVERLPHDNFEVYVTEGAMGDYQYPGVRYSGEWDNGSPEAMEIKREAIDAALAKLEGKV